MRALQAILVLGFLLSASPCRAQSLTTGVANNGSGGVFLTLTPATTALQFTGFSTYFGSGTVGTAGSVEVWTRPGDYTGFTGANTGWTLTQTVTGFAAGTTTLSAPVTLTTPIDLPLGGPTSIYLHGVTTGNALRYNGTGTTSLTTFSNADISFFSNIARTGAVPYAGTQFTPRAFAGTVFYTSAVPEPATLGLLGLITAGAFARRRDV